MKFQNNEKKIILENGKEFDKTIQEVYPSEFTAWINGIIKIKFTIFILFKT